MHYFLGKVGLIKIYDANLQKVPVHSMTKCFLREKNIHNCTPPPGSPIRKGVFTAQRLWEACPPGGHGLGFPVGSLGSHTPSVGGLHVAHGSALWTRPPTRPHHRPALSHQGPGSLGTAQREAQAGRAGPAGVYCEAAPEL